MAGSELMVQSLHYTDGETEAQREFTHQQGEGFGNHWARMRATASGGTAPHPTAAALSPTSHMATQSDGISLSFLSALWSHTTIL